MSESSRFIDTSILSLKVARSAQCRLVQVTCHTKRTSSHGHIKRYLQISFQAKARVSSTHETRLTMYAATARLRSVLRDCDPYDRKDYLWQGERKNMLQELESQEAANYT